MRKQLQPGAKSHRIFHTIVVPLAQVRPPEASLVRSADNVNLRTGPGTVFPVRRLLARGTRLQLQGHAPGGEWVYVRADTNINGWVLHWLLSGGHDGGTTPLIEPQAVQAIEGAVADEAGVPISGIGFAITQGNGVNVPRTDATTDSAGQFYAYLPASASGT